MPSRQINEFSQKGNRKKIELVARPGDERMNELLVDWVDPEETTSLRSEHPLKPINTELTC